MPQVNIALEIFCMILSLVLLGGLALNGDRTSRDTRMFLGMLLGNLLFLGADALAWFWNGSSRVLWNWLGNLGQYLAGYGLLLLYCQYLLDRLSPWGRWRWVRRGVAGLCLAGVVLTVLSQGTGLFYTITPDNLFQRGPGFWLSQGIALGALALVGGGIAACWKEMTRGEDQAGLLYVLLPMGVIGASLFWEAVTLLGLGSTLTLVLVFVNVQLQRGRRLREQDKELAEKKIAIMLSQIQPHFLFNVLGSIEWLCETAPAKAQEATDELARFLRGNMDSLKSTKPIPATRELEHVRCYLNLERIRFGSHLQVEYDIGPTDFFLPALSLQPLVENAVRHAMKDEGALHIAVRVRSEGGEGICIEVSDDGAGMDRDTAARLFNASLPMPDSQSPQGGGAGVATRNISERIKRFYGPRSSAEVSSTPGEGTTITLHLDLQESMFA